jgi:hypothetical protein
MVGDVGRNTDCHDRVWGDRYVLTGVLFRHKLGRECLPTTEDEDEILTDRDDLTEIIELTDRVHPNLQPEPKDIPQ